MQEFKTCPISTGMIIEDVSISTTRGGCETVFHRVNKEEIMREKIPYRLIAFLPYGHALAHREANLNQPLWYPGRSSIIGGNY